MSFFHVPSSNVANVQCSNVAMFPPFPPETFPQNHTSAYSTPVTNDYHLKGKWEVALLNITYSECVNTFHQDDIIVEKTFRLKERLLTCNKPFQIGFTYENITQLANDINTKLNGVITLTLDKKQDFCT